MTMSGYHYVLDGHTPVVEQDTLIWARWFESADRRVARTEVPGGVVSTVFLGLDHNFSLKGAPLLFESMAFLDGDDADCERCSTWEQAEEQPRRMVEKLSGPQKA